MPRGRDAVKTELTEQRQQDFLDELVFAAPIEVGRQLVAALDFGRRQWPMGVRLHHW